MVNEEERPMELTTPPGMVEEDNTEEEVAALVADDETSSEESTDTESSGPVTLAIDPEDISGSINRLMQTDPKVLNVINAMIGQKGKTKYEPRINELELELEAFRAQSVQQQIADMPEATRNERLATDDNFRQAYSQAQNAEQVLTQKRQAQAVLSRINNDIELATERGLSYDRANELLNNVAEGKYDFDANGKPLSTQQALANFQGALFDELSGIARPPVENNSNNGTNSATSTPDLEDALDTASPDLGASSGTATGGPMFALDQVAQMDPIEFERNFPDDDSYNNAIAEGRITGISKEARSVFESR